MQIHTIRRGAVTLPRCRSRSSAPQTSALCLSLLGIVISQGAGLWSSIRIGHELHQPFRSPILDGGLRWYKPPILSLCAFSGVRSKSHPLNIILDFASSMPWPRMQREVISANLMPFIRILVGHLGQHALHWQALECHSLDDAPEIISILPHHLLPSVVRVSVGPTNQLDISSLPKARGRRTSRTLGV